MNETLRKPLTERFLNVFQGDTRNNLLAFSRQLWEHDSDVFIFMARKAACLFDCLRELKLADVRGLALSDRVLDMDLSFLKGKRVTLVDDCIFTGTTLYNARNAVIEAGCASFDTIALAVNIDSVRPNLLPNGDEAEDLRIQEPVFASNDSDCVSQCYDIVRAISLLPRPYDVDFPHCKTLKMKDSEFDDLLHIPGWIAFDETADFQRTHQVRVFSLMPFKDVQADFCDHHRSAPSHLVCGKIRIYARQTASSSWSVRLVPIVMFPELDDAQVLRVLQDSCVTDADVIIDTGLKTPQSRYRFLHFLVAHSFLDFFCSQPNCSSLLPAMIQLRKDLIEMAYGERFSEKYEQYWPDRTRVNLPPPHQGAVASYSCTFDSVPRFLENPGEMVAESLAPFTWLYKERELGTRSFVREHGLLQATVKQFPHIKRLLEGFTPHFLFNRLQNPMIDTRFYMSYLLDRFIDIGIAVPTIVQTRNVCCRAFRHGEDAILGEAQERLLLLAIRTYMESRDVSSIWGLELQKLIVLVVQISLRINLMDRLNMLSTIPVGACVVSIKGHLHGPVPTIGTVTDPSGSMGSPFIAGNDAHPRWLADSWVTKGYLTSFRNKAGTQYKLATLPTLSIGTQAEAKARQIGRCLGAACAKTSITVDRDFVMLSTCAEIDDQIRALSGEIAIVRDRWPQVNKNLQVYMKSRQYKEARDELRHGGDVFEAVNSGARKYRWFASGDFASTVSRVTEEFEKAGEGAMVDLWVQYWPKAIPINKGSVSRELTTAIRSGRWLVVLNVAMRLIDYWYVLRLRSTSEVDEKTISDVITDVKRWIANANKAFFNTKPPAYVKNMESVLVRIDERDEQTAFQWCKESADVLTTFVRGDAKQLLDCATAICSAYGAIDSEIVYTYAVFIDIEPIGESYSLMLHRCIEASLVSNKVEQFYLLPDVQNPWRSGRWVLFPGNRNSTTAVSFIHAVVTRLITEQLRFRASIVGQLKMEDCIRRFSHSPIYCSGFFFRWLALLGTQIFSNDFDNVVHCVNQTQSEGIDEIMKYARVCNLKGETPKCMTVTIDKPDVPNKTFSVSSLRHVKADCVQTTASESLSGGQAVPQTVQPTILLCTATDKEDDAVADYLSANGLSAQPLAMAKGSYKEVLGLRKTRVIWVRSGMGSGGPGGSFATTQDAIYDTSPDYVISCGIAFGHNSEKQQIGDILVSEFVRHYESGRVGEKGFLPRGGRISADPHLLQAVKLVRRDVLPLRVLTGTLLSGNKLVDDPSFKSALWKIEPEAIGGDMEGSGVVDACDRQRKRWIVIKAICDWGENKGDGDQPKAAENAVKFVFSVIESGSLIPR